MPSDASVPQEGPGRFKGSKAPYEGQAATMLGTWVPSEASNLIDAGVNPLWGQSM